MTGVLRMDSSNATLRMCSILYLAGITFYIRDFRTPCLMLRLLYLVLIKQNNGRHEMLYEDLHNLCFFLADIISRN